MLCCCTCLPQVKHASSESSLQEPHAHRHPDYASNSACGATSRNPNAALSIYTHLQADMSCCYVSGALGILLARLAGGPCVRRASPAAQTLRLDRRARGFSRTLQDCQKFPLPRPAHARICMPASHVRTPISMHVLARSFSTIGRAKPAQKLQRTPPLAVAPNTSSWTGSRAVGEVLPPPKPLPQGGWSLLPPLEIPTLAPPLKGVPAMMESYSTAASLNPHQRSWPTGLLCAISPTCGWVCHPATLRGPD